MTLEERLDALYAKVKKTHCTKGCTKCCGPVPMMGVEAKRLGLKQNYTKWDKDFRCQFASEDGCSVYENRPFVCRVFGTDTTSPISCPINKHLPVPHTEDDIIALMKEYMNLIIEEDEMSTFDRDTDLYKAMQEYERKIGWKKDKPKPALAE